MKYLIKINPLKNGEFDKQIALLFQKKLAFIKSIIKFY